MNLVPVDHDPFATSMPALIPVDHDPFAAASGPLSNAPDEGWMSGAAKGAATGAIKGLSNIPGVFGNIRDFADYLVNRGESAITGRPYEEVAAQNQAKKSAIEAANPLLKYTNPANILPSGQDIAAPILARTGEYRPSSELGRMAQTGVEAAAGMVGPGAGAVAQEANLAQALVRTPLKMAPGNIAAGAVGQGVTDISGDPLLGTLAGASTPSMAAIPGGIARPIVAPFAEDIPGIGSRFAGTREAMVADQLRKAATSPDALHVGTAPSQQIVPGSQPTLGQLTGDQGILQAERQARTADNSGFNISEGEQNQARLAALRAAAPAAADTMSVSRAFQGHLDNIDQATDAAVSQLSSKAQDLAAQLGHGMTPEATGAAIRSGIETARGEAKAVRKSLYDAVDPDQTLNLVASPIRDAAAGIQGSVGKYAEQPSGKEASILTDASKLPDVMKFHDVMDFDQRLTAALSEERRSAGESPAWGRMRNLKGAVQDAINNALENQAAFDKQSVANGQLAPDAAMEARLRDLWNVPTGANRANASQSIAGAGIGAVGLSRGQPAGNLGATRAGSEVGGGLRPPAGNQGISAPQPALGLRQVDIDPQTAAVAKQHEANGAPPDVAYEHAVLSAALADPKVQGIQDGEQLPAAPEPIQNATQALTEPRQAIAGARAAQVSALGKGLVGGPPQTATAGQLPNFDEAAARRLAAAKASHAEYARTYRQGPVAPVLKTTGFSGNYALPSSAVPARAFVKGDRGYQATKAFLDASKNNPDALAAIQDHALNPLRDSLLPDGTVNPKKFAAWRSDYEGSLRAIDEAAPGFSDRFANAAKASDELMQAGRDRKAKLDEFQKTAAARFLGKTTPTEVENQLGLMLQAKTAGVTQMRALVKQASSDPNAMDGLRKAGVDWMVRQFSNAAEAPGTGEKTISSARFRKFVDENQATLAELYPEKQMQAFRDVAADLQRADRSVTATAIKGSPGTAKDILPFFQKGLEQARRHTSLIGAAQAGAIAGFVGGHIPGGIAGAGSAAALYGLNTLRETGLSKVDAMFRDALLNPERARYYTSKPTPGKTEVGSLYALSRAVRRSLAAGSAMQGP